MKSLLEDLWYGNIPTESMHIMSQNERKIIQELVKKENEILKRLEKGNKLIEEYVDLQNQYTNECSKEAFVRGFCFGAKMIMEVIQTS